MSQPAPSSGFPVDALAIGQAHQLYCQLTGQSLRLAFDRERMWYELLRLGYSLQDLRSSSPICNVRSGLNAATSALSSSPISSNSTASRRTSR